MRAPEFLGRYAVPGRSGEELVYAQLLDGSDPVGWARFAFRNPIHRAAFRNQQMFPDDHVTLAVLFRDEKSPLPPEVGDVDLLYRPCELDFLWSELRAGLWTYDRSYRLRFVDGSEGEKVAERVFDEPYDEPHGPTPAQRADELVLPRRRWLARTAEFLPLAGLTVASFFTGLDSPSSTGLSSLGPGIVFAAPVLFGGAVLGGGRTEVRRGVLCVENLFRRTTYRHWTCGGVRRDSGVVRIFLVGHGMVNLRWPGQGLSRTRLGSSTVPEQIERAYGIDSYAQVPGWGLVEKSWIWGRLTYWAVAVVLSPLPFVIGAVLARSSAAG